MDCARCGGYMVVNEVLDLHASAALRWVRGWKCVNCGHCMDPVIEENRAGSRPKNQPPDLIAEADDGHPYYSR